MDLGGSPRGPGPAGPIVFLKSFYISFFLLGPLLSNQSSQLNLDSNYPIKKLNKNNKNIHNSDCILAKKLFYHQRTKKLCVIGEVKTKFFAITVN